MCRGEPSSDWPPSGGNSACNSSRPNRYSTRPRKLISSPDARAAGPLFESLQALDWLNFFLAALLMGFGPFVAVHLAHLGWAPASIGFVLTASGLAGLISQVPGGEIIDMIRSKRMLVGAGAGAVALALLIFGLRPDFPSIVAAAVIQGSTGSVLGPGIAAISLGLVGHDALANRLGRNQRFASFGGLAAAAILGAIGYLLSTRDIFLITAALCVPLFWTLFRIRASDIHFARSCGAPDHQDANPQRLSRLVLFRDRRLVTFASGLFLFQLANASLLSQVSQRLVHAEGRSSSLVVGALIVGPQIIIALLAPWAGRTAATWGRRPLLLVGLAVLPIRSTLFALVANPTLLVLVQLLDGLSGATLGVLTALVIADLTSGTGRFNLAQGLVGALSGIGASLSTSISGIIVENLGHTAGLLSATGAGLLAVAIVSVFMPETSPVSRRRPNVATRQEVMRNFERMMSATSVGCWVKWIRGRVRSH